MRDRSRDGEDRHARERRPQRLLEREPHPPRERGDHHEPAADAQQPAHRAGGQADEPQPPPLGPAAPVVGEEHGLGSEPGAGSGLGCGDADRLGGTRRRPAQPVGAVRDQRGGDDHEHVAVPGDRVSEQRPADGGGDPGARHPRHDPGVHEPGPPVADGSRQAGRQYRGQGRGDRCDRGRPEHPDRGRRDDRAAHAEHSRQHTGQDPGDPREEDFHEVRHGHGGYRSRMAIERDLRGVYVPLVTPFAADGSVALDAIERMANRYLDAGVAGLVPLGTTGESPLLDAGEKRSVIEVVARVCTERHAQLIVGAGTNNTASTVAAVEALGEVAAVTHALVVSPYYLRPSQRGLLEHFRTVAGASPVPVVLYNIPSRTGVTIEADTMLELASVPNIAGVKQAVNGIDAATLRILAEAPPTFALLGGDDPYLLPTVLVGGTGAICASAHVCTERFVAM